MGPRNSFRGCRGARSGSRWRGVFLDRGAEFVERAIVTLILAGDPLGNRFHAFESGAGVEEGTLLAAVQFETAARAFAVRVKALLQHGTAIRTSRPRDRAHHARCPRADLLLPRMPFVRTFFLFWGLVGTHVAPVLILPVQGNLRGEFSSYSESENATRKLRKPVNIH